MKHGVEEDKEDDDDVKIMKQMMIKNEIENKS